MKRLCLASFALVLGCSGSVDLNGTPSGWTPSRTYEQFDSSNEIPLAIAANQRDLFLAIGGPTGGSSVIWLSEDAGTLHPSSWQFDAAVTGLVADDVDTFVAAADGEVASFFGSSLPVTGTGAGALALDAKAVYVAAVVEDKHAIVAIDRATLSTKTLVADAGEPVAIATDATRVYWVDVGTTQAEFRPTVRVIEKAGGEPRQLTTTASPQAPGTVRLTTTEDALTFADALGNLYRVDKDSGQTFPLSATIVSAAAGWGPAVVFTDVSGQTLSSVDARADHAPDEQTVDTIDAQYRISALAFTPEGDRLFAMCNQPGGLVRAYEATR